MENIIEIKGLDFAIRIVNLYKYLQNTHKEYVLSKQILRSGTSIGANISEAQYGQSKADFSSKMNMALKETNETKYWLTLLYKTEYISDEQYNSLMNDTHEIISILMSICKTSNSNKENRQ
ncbi:MAG: four helix bundle protein [Eubacteriales bacterium]|nr:four helix bundle protein [Eubacteriales bacterium]